MKAFATPFILLALLAPISIGSALAQSPGQEAATEVRAAVTAFNQAYERNELDAYFAFYRDDAGLWLDSGRLSLADYKTQWYQLIADGGGVEKNLISDLQVVADSSGDAAVATYLIEVDTRQPDGSVTKEQAHETDVWFKSDGTWLAVHVNYSAKPRE